MTDLQAYMESGVIESYWLGQLDGAQIRDVERMAERFPEIRAEIARTADALRHRSTAIHTLRARKECILHTLQQLHLEQDITLDNLPLLTPYSDYRRWLAVVGHLQPTDRLDGVEYCILRDHPTLVQMLVWVADSAAEEGHDPDSFQESFLVLEGECECDLGGTIIHLSAGDYLNIPANTLHLIRNLHPGHPLMGIVQRYRAVA